MVLPLLPRHVARAARGSTSFTTGHLSSPACHLRSALKYPVPGIPVAVDRRTALWYADTVMTMPAPKSVKPNGHMKAERRLIAKVYATPRYRGKWVIVIHGKAVPHLKGRAGLRQLQGLTKRYPEETPTIVYVPKAEALILLL